MMDLSCLKRGQGGRVGRLRARDGLRRRLMDLGFTPGAQVEYLFSLQNDSIIRQMKYILQHTPVIFWKKTMKM